MDNGKSAVNIHAADDHHPGNNPTNVLHQRFRLISGTKNQVDQDIRSKRLDLGAIVRDLPGIANDVLDFRWQRRGARAAMNRGHAVPASLQVADYMRPNKTSAAKHQNLNTRQKDKPIGQDSGAEARLERGLQTEGAAAKGRGYRSCFSVSASSSTAVAVCERSRNFCKALFTHSEPSSMAPFSLNVAMARPAISVTLRPSSSSTTSESACSFQSEGEFSERFSSPSSVLMRATKAMMRMRMRATSARALFSCRKSAQ